MENEQDREDTAGGRDDGIGARSPRKVEFLLELHELDDVVGGLGVFLLRSSQILEFFEKVGNGGVELVFVGHFIEVEHGSPQA